MPDTAPIATPPSAPITAPEGSNPPAGALEPGQADSFKDAFASLEADYTSEAGSNTPAKKAAADKPPEAKPAAKPEAKPEAKAAEAAKPDTKGKAPEAKEQFDASKAAPAQLRTAYERLQAKHAELEKAHKTATSKASTPDPERAKLSETLAAREKRVADLEERIRYTDYSQSDEYKEQYEKPFVDAWMGAQARISGLRVLQEDPQTGDIGPGRKATGDDFNTLMRISDDEEASAWAEKTFGASKAPLVLMQREAVMQLNAKKAAALGEFKTKGAEWSKAKADKAAAESQEFEKIWTEEGQRAAERFPQYFAPSDDDPKTAELLNEGFRDAERAFFPNKPPGEGEKPMTKTELAHMQRAMFNRAAAFPRVAHELRKSNARIKEMEATIAEYEKSEPRGGDGKGQRGSGNVELTPEASFDKRFGGA